MRGLTAEERRLLEDCTPGPIDNRRQITDAELELVDALIQRGLVRMETIPSPFPECDVIDIYTMTATGKLAIELDALVRNCMP